MDSHQLIWKRAASHLPKRGFSGVRTGGMGRQDTPGTRPGNGNIFVKKIRHRIFEVWLDQIRNLTSQGVAMRSIAFLVVVALSISACGPAVSTTPEATLRRPSNVLTQDEIRQASLADAYEGVVSLRSHWFNRGNPAVAVDHLLAGDINELRGISVSEVKQIELLDASAASQRFGQRGFRGGVILVTLARAESSGG